MKKIGTKKTNNLFRKVSAAISTTAFAVSMMAMPAYAGGFDQSVTISNTDNLDAGSLMGKIIGILLTITRFVGVALVIYGVYEIVMSFMQNQPEAKTKGIVMALAGVVMIALKSVLQGMGIFQ